ncbi:carboxymuconolactone decarboxylase family protein [Streptomyces albofaciens JCM 4342]|uniref:carboxymuconolactone decarboxylase family protein n=1 Tax=Streptomyces albofaciens TaxID=66866 RepID=UPI001238EC7A|nr:carboxymuconolactone decarboxylase family protein [Streptomyces albofaciens]KAA6214416.1 carboxymuconolactone decarboxylase family protein [Streptomyces albofaciens JCM 4342]
MTNTTQTAGTETSATRRLDFARTAPKAFKALLAFDSAAREHLDPALVELVQIRASQLNHCAYCLHMHTTDARKRGESDERLDMVAAWREARGFFTERERAALALTEAVTRLADQGVPDEEYARAAEHFDDTELAGLLTLTFAINTWNRIAVSTGKTPGSD